MSDSNHKEGRLLEEWKVAMENARHFNDLLMRLRTLGLPMVISIIGAGAALLGTDLKFEVKQGWVDVTGTIIGVCIIAYVISTIIDSIKRRKCEFTVHMYGWEYMCWFMAGLAFFGLFLTSLICDAGSVAEFNTSRSYAVGTFVMLAGLGLLGALYLLDRFYYYKLLIGSIKRITEIEETLTPPMHITKRTSQFIPVDRATRLITYFYWMPGMVTLPVALVLMLFA